MNKSDILHNSLNADGFVAGIERYSSGKSR